MKNNCMLIGGCGFIGRNIAACFIKHGYAVTIVDRVHNPDFLQANSQIKYIEGDYFNGAVNDEILSEQDFVFLLATGVGPKTSMEYPEKCYDQDIISMIHLLEQMKRLHLKRLILLSSGGTVYGNQKEEFLKEHMQTFPINHYGIMKLTQEKILLMYNKLYGMENVIFRVANPYGPGQQISSGIGAVTAFMKNITEGSKIQIYGTGNIVRDYIYIKDAVNMMYFYLIAEDQDKDFPIFNIGTGVGTNLIELVKLIEKITGKVAHIEYLPERGIDVERNVLNTEKIQKIIGEYRCLSLLEGITKYYEESRGV